MSHSTTPSAARRVLHNHSTFTSIPIGASPTPAAASREEERHAMKLFWKVMGITYLALGVFFFFKTQVFQQLQIKHGSAWSYIVTLVLALVTSGGIMFDDKLCRKLSPYASVMPADVFRAVIRMVVITIISVGTKVVEDASQHVTADAFNAGSNIFFALAAISCCKIYKVGYELGFSSYFIGCCVMQLLKFGYGVGILLGFIGGLCLVFLHDLADD